MHFTRAERATLVNAYGGVCICRIRGLLCEGCTQRFARAGKGDIRAGITALVDFMSLHPVPSLLTKESKDVPN